MGTSIRMQLRSRNRLQCSKDHEVITTYKHSLSIYKEPGEKCFKVPNSKDNPQGQRNTNYSVLSLYIVYLYAIIILSPISMYNYKNNT